MNFWIDLYLWLVGIFYGGYQWLLNQIVVPLPPGWFTDGVVAINTLMVEAGKLGHWIPWPIAVIVGLAVTGCVVAALVIQAVRIIASFFSLGGGAT